MRGVTGVTSGAAINALEGDEWQRKENDWYIAAQGESNGW